MGWWGSTFPLGSLAICTARIAIALDSLALKVVYTVFVFVTFGVWLVVFVPTVIGFCNGSLLSRKAAPCIADLPLDPLRRDEAGDDGQEMDEEQEEAQDENTPTPPCRSKEGPGEDQR